MGLHKSIADLVGGETDKQALGGVLKINIIEAKMFRDTEAIGKMDPFIQI
jgi:hypothetical protein